MKVSLLSLNNQDCWHGGIDGKDASMRPKDPFIGREILDGQYQIVQKIGSGGMGSVYKATQPEMNRMVAIKILHPRLAGRKDLVSRFRREARAMSQLSHPNTVRVFMYGELDDGSLYIVMELLDGRSLNQAVRRDGPMPVEKAAPLFAQVCGALQEAHSMGIVHRDLKPENIFLCNQGGLVDYPKVLDFGLAKVTEQQMRPGSIILTQEGMVFGTPEFMSPEQAQGKPLDARSDIYSLAVILFEVLTGKLPFVTQTAMEFIQRHVMEKPRRLIDAAPERVYSPELEAVIARALAKNPAERWQSALEFSRAVDETLLPASVRSVVSINSDNLPVPPSGQAPKVGIVVSPWLMMLLGSVACVLLGILIALVLLRWVIK